MTDSDTIREALRTGKQHYALTPRAKAFWEDALAALDRRDAQDAKDQEHLTQVVAKHVAERAALEAERDEARAETKRVILDGGQVITRVVKRAVTAEERSRQLAEALSEAADLLERMVADNARGPDMGWTHEDEPADTLRRHVGYVISDLRDALASPSRDSAEPSMSLAAQQRRTIQRRAMRTFLDHQCRADHAVTTDEETT